LASFFVALAKSLTSRGLSTAQGIPVLLKAKARGVS